MSAVATPLMSVPEFQQWVNRPENAGRTWELENGQLIEMPPPGGLHGISCVLLVRILANYLFDINTGHMTTADAGWIVSHDPPIVRGPDVMLYLKPMPFGEAPTGWFETPPDLIVEVFSPSDRPGKLHKRISQYFAGQVKLVWVIYPEDRSVTVYLPNEFPQILEENDTLQGYGVLPNFSCPVVQLFRNPGEKN
jgi:Uma2 family endonuclease